MEDKKAASSASPAPLKKPNKVTIKTTDMPEDMQNSTVEISKLARDNHTIEREIAMYTKREMDKRHGPTWHVVVGRNFGSFVTHGTLLSCVF